MQAKEKAVTIADAGGFRSGKLPSIDTNDFATTPHRGMGIVTDELIRGITQSIELGSEDVIIGVTLIYKIK